MNYQAWPDKVSEQISGDPLRQVDACRRAWFLADSVGHAATKLMQDKRTFRLANQLYETLGSNLVTTLTNLLPEPTPIP